MEGLSRVPSSEREPVPMMQIPIESDVYKEVAGEIKDVSTRKKEVPAEVQKSPADTKDAAKEKAAELAREKLYTEVDIALRKLQIESGAAEHALSEPEARALVQKMEEVVGGFTFYDGVFLDQMKDKGEAFVDTKRSAKITTSTGNEAVFKVMLKVGTGEFKLQGDVLDPKGQYAEKLMSP